MKVKTTYTKKTCKNCRERNKNIPWWNIDFNKSYVLFYSKREQKEKFDTLEHSKIILYYDFFKCKCGTQPYLGDNLKREFYPYLW
ncbi:3750_t:CDS:2, partial [Cetraspora pellucida]